MITNRQVLAIIDDILDDDIFHNTDALNILEDDPEAALEIIDCEYTHAEVTRQDISSPRINFLTCDYPFSLYEINRWDDDGGEYEQGFNLTLVPGYIDNKKVFILINLESDNLTIEAFDIHQVVDLKKSIKESVKRFLISDFSLENKAQQLPSILKICNDVSLEDISGVYYNNRALNSIGKVALNNSESSYHYFQSIHAHCFAIGEANILVATDTRPHQWRKLTDVETLLFHSITETSPAYKSKRPRMVDLKSLEPAENHSMHIPSLLAPGV